LRKQVQFRLLVVRLGAMGDILHALPAVTALRKAHPAWKIGWAVEPRWKPLLCADSSDLAAQCGSLTLRLNRTAATPIIDQLHLVPAKAWGRKPLSRTTLDGIRALRAELKAGEYDAVLDLQGSIRSAVVGRLSGCRRILGSAEPWEKPARWLYSEPVETSGAHVIEQNVELASAVFGDLLMPTRPLLPVDEAAEAWCDSLAIALPELEKNKPVVLIHPGAGWGAKRWPASRYGAVAEELTDCGMTVLVNAGPGEESLAAEVVTASRGRATVVGCSLEQLIALSRRISLAVGGDTGPLHLACALGKPVVGIYGPTDPSRNGPYGSSFRVLRNPESRRDHTRRSEPEAGLLTITPESVVAAALELLVPDPETTALPGWESGPS
jgi:heptosyltransferase-1